MKSKQVNLYLQSAGDYSIVDDAGNVYSPERAREIVESGLLGDHNLAFARLVASEYSISAVQELFARQARARGAGSSTNNPMPWPKRASFMNVLPATGLVRLSQIIGNPNAEPPIPPIIPVKKSSWWAGVKSGRYPKPVKLGRLTAWRSEDIRAIIERGAPS